VYYSAVLLLVTIELIVHTNVFYFVVFLITLHIRAVGNVVDDLFAHVKEKATVMNAVMLKAGNS
jgi:hypothetical protein